MARKSARAGLAVRKRCADGAPSSPLKSNNPEVEHTGRYAHCTDKETE